MNKLTQDEYVSRIYNLYNNEYTVIGKYTKALDKIKIRHNVCGTLFDVCASNFANGKSKCPLCTKNSKNINDDVFKLKIKELTNNEYTPLVKYKGANIKIMMRHNNCSCDKGYYDWEITPHNFINGNQRCPFESHQQKYTIDDFINRLYIYHPDYKYVSGDYKNSSSKIQVSCNKDHVFETTLDNIAKKCPYCSSIKVLKGFNDIATTNPKVFNVLTNKNDGYKYAYNTHTKLSITCPFCGNKMKKIPSIIFNKNGEFICNSCYDGFSYPEKFFTNFLNQLKVDYIFQLTSADFKWCGKYRYDFYIPKYNLIIEIHGRQHYIDTTWCSLEDVKKNDLQKEILAKENGYNYLIIDASFSDRDYIKKSIIESRLNHLFDLSYIDWDKCNNDSIISIKQKVYDYYKHNYKVDEISKILHISKDTVVRYIDYNKKEKIS